MALATRGHLRWRRRSVVDAQRPLVLGLVAADAGRDRDGPEIRDPLHHGRCWRRRAQLPRWFHGARQRLVVAIEKKFNYQTC